MQFAAQHLCMDSQDIGQFLLKSPCSAASGGHFLTKVIEIGGGICIGVSSHTSILLSIVIAGVQVPRNHLRNCSKGEPIDSQPVSQSSALRAGSLSSLPTRLMVNLLIASPATHCVLRLRRQQGCKEQVSSLRLRQAARKTASQSDRRQGTYRDQQAAHGNPCRENACCSRRGSPHEPDSGDELSHGFVRGKETHDDRLD